MIYILVLHFDIAKNGFSSSKKITTYRKYKCLDHAVLINASKIMSKSNISCPAYGAEEK